MTPPAGPEEVREPKTLEQLLDDISNLVIEGLLSQETALLLITEINAKRRSRLAKLEQERGREGR